jgi:hypothetical protein
MQHDIWLSDFSFATLAGRRSGDKASSLRLPPLKARILPLIRRAGPADIGGGDQFAIAYDDHLPRYRGGHKGRGASQARTTLKAHTCQINQQLNGYRIVGERCALAVGSDWFACNGPSDFYD